MKILMLSLILASFIACGTYSDPGVEYCYYAGRLCAVYPEDYYRCDDNMGDVWYEIWYDGYWEMWYSYNRMFNHYCL